MSVHTMRMQDTNLFPNNHYHITDLIRRDLHVYKIIFRETCEKDTEM